MLLSLQAANPAWYQQLTAHLSEVQGEDMEILFCFDQLRSRSRHFLDGRSLEPESEPPGAEPPKKVAVPHHWFLKAVYFIQIYMYYAQCCGARYELINRILVWIWKEPLDLQKSFNQKAEELTYTCTRCVVRRGPAGPLAGRR